MKSFNYRRILIVTFMLALFSSQVSWAGQASFSWMANDDSGVTAGYMLHYGTSSREYTESVDVGSPTPSAGWIDATVSQLEPGQTYFFTVTAYSAAGSHSPYPAEVICSVPSDPVDGGSNGDYEILATTSSSLSGAVPLDGSIIEGDIYIFTGPDTGVSRVIFSVDGSVVHTEGLAPFELAGGASYDTSQLSPGTHEIKADITLSNGGSTSTRAVFTIPSADDPYPNSGMRDIYFSKNSNLSAAALLEGAAVEENMYVFTSPDTGVSRVTFSVDGVVTQREGVAPYELAGGAAFDTSQLSPGEHEITAEFDLDDGSTEIVSAVFTIPGEDDSIYNLLVSDSSYLSAATDLDEAYVDGDIYVFTSPDSGVSRVTFLVDGVVTQREGLAPYELAGGAAFNTSQLSNGEHEIIAAIELNDGSSEQITATFTVR